MIGKNTNSRGGHIYATSPGWQVTICGYLKLD